ncbi:MAG: hypothetical protein RB292_04165 [Patescibacteria group bacterium]|jgi:phosphoribosylaminoimidazolecarboxamide formyltransferase/IMP cyclohydrolase|nr:hypothetical protein [Patescibacteria group bacterium]
MQRKSRLALVSVTNKAGLDALAPFLAKRGWRFLASGGTAEHLRKVGVEVIDMADWLTNSFVRQARFAQIADFSRPRNLLAAQVSEALPFGQLFGGRVKTLSREKSAALLVPLAQAEKNADLERMGIEPIEMVVLNYYTLLAATQEPDATVEAVVEKMDIGGPGATLEAIKGNRIVLCNPADYEQLMAEMNEAGDISDELRAQLRLKAIELVAGYYRPLAEFLAKQAN